MAIQRRESEVIGIVERYGSLNRKRLTRPTLDSRHSTLDLTAPAMPRRSSSSSWMMIRGVTIIIRLSVSRPMPTLRNSRLMYGTFESSGTPNSLRPSESRLMPPKQHRAAVGHAHRRHHGDELERRQLHGDAAARLLPRCPPPTSFLPSSSSSVELLELVVDVEPSNVNSVDVADLREERHDRQPHVAPVVGDHGLNRHHRAFVEHDDHRLLRGGELADDRDHADHERPLTRRRPRTPADR